MKETGDTRWLLLFCLSRMGFGVIGTAYAALIPLLRPAWGMSAGQAGAVQSAWHLGYIVSLVVASLLSGRYGAKRTFIGMGYAACATAVLFALGAQDFRSAVLFYGLAGLCAGGSYVPGLTLIAERFPSSTRGRAMGAYIAAASLGYALGLVGSSALAACGGYSLRSILGFGMGALSPWLFGVVLDNAGGSARLAWGLAWSALGTVALAGSLIAWRLHRLQTTPG
ncbi:MAG: MFS transporter [Betaproteobacteria bacterium]|nr:MFS transporter [Betaproteobacteria bacterium]